MVRTLSTVVCLKVGGTEEQGTYQLEQDEATEEMGPVYRHRRCLSCGAVFPAGELKPLRYGGGHWHGRGGSRRKCPNCGRVGFTQEFPIVKPKRGT
jgi:ribosomal protein S27AE